MSLPTVGDVYDTSLEGPGSVLLCINVRPTHFSTIFEFFILTGSDNGSLIRTWAEQPFAFDGFTMQRAMKSFHFKQIA